MHAALLHTLTGDPDGPLDSSLGSGLPAADVESTAYLDGQTIYDGTLAGEIAEETEVPVVTGDAITTTREERTRRVATTFYADLDTGWAGVDSGDGIPLLESYLRSAGARVEDTECRLDAWAERLETDDEADVWGVVHSHSIENGHREDAAAARYHAEVGSSLPTTGKTVVGFEYPWSGALARGVVTASGYVAIYRDWPTEQFAKWVSEEIAEYLQIETDDQQSLTGPTCEGCGRESQTIEDSLCVVCRDAEEGQESDA